MTVIKTSSVTKVMGDGPGLTTPVNYPIVSGPPSPIRSVTPSQGSRSMLIPSAPQAKDDIKSKKKKILNQTKNLKQKRLKSILWLLLITSLFALIVCVAVTLVNSLHDNFLFREQGTSESVICEPSGKCETKSQRMRDFKNIEMLETRSESDGHRCIHRRSIMDDRNDNSEIIHDLSTKWSAIVEHDDERCLIFDMRNLEVAGCPKEYPWSLDMRIGIPVCKTSLDQIAPIRRVLRHILDDNLQNTSFAGYLTAKLCSSYKNAIVDKVIVQYFDAYNNRIVKRSVLDHVENEKRVLNKRVTEQKHLRKRSIKMVKNLKKLTSKHENENFIQRVYRSLDRKYLFTAPDGVTKQRRNPGQSEKISNKKKNRTRINLKAIRLFHESRKANPKAKPVFERMVHNTESAVKWSLQSHPYGHLKWPKSRGQKAKSLEDTYKEDEINPAVNILHDISRRSMTQSKPHHDQESERIRTERNFESNIKDEPASIRGKHSIIKKSIDPRDEWGHGEDKAETGQVDNKPKVLLSTSAKAASAQVRDKSNHKKEQKRDESETIKSMLENEIIFGQYNPFIPGHWEMIISEIGRNGKVVLTHKFQLPVKDAKSPAVWEIHNLITAAVEADLHKIFEKKQHEVHQ